MRRLITNSFKIFRVLPSNPYLLSSFNHLTINRFSTSKQQKSKVSNTSKPKKSQVAQPLQIKLKEVLTPQEKQRQIMGMSQEQAHKQALKIMQSYITIDQIKSQPYALRHMMLTLIRCLQYQPSNSGRQFYLAHRSAIQKIFYDIRCYNAQSSMNIEDILITFYMYKILKDYGYHSSPTGFELRGGIMLAKYVPSDGTKTDNRLSFQQVIHAWWLMAVTGMSNHDFKWQAHMMIVNVLTKWNNAHSFDSKTSTPVSLQNFPIRLHHICTVLTSFYHQPVHLNTDFRSADLMNKILFINASHYLTYDQLMANENIFLETFTCVIGLDMHFFPGNNFHQMKTVINMMARSIQRRLLQWLLGDKHLAEAFLKQIKLDKFLNSQHYPKYQLLLKQNRETQTLLKNFTDLDLQRYFILLNEIHQNRQLMCLKSPQNYDKLMFLLQELFNQYFTPILNNKDTLVNTQTLSLYARIQLIMINQKVHNQHTMRLKSSNNFDLNKLNQKQCEITNIKPNQQLPIQHQITTSFFSMIDILIQKQGLSDQGGEKSKTSKKCLTANDKQTLEEKNVKLKKIQRNVVNPIVDFIYQLKKYTLGPQKVVQPSIVIQMIEKFQILLTLLFGEQPSSTQPKHQNILSFENKYFWSLKFMRHKFTTTTDNKRYLKDFQTILLEHIIKNNLKKQPSNLYIVSVYNLYAYMCLVQERMIANETEGEEISVTGLQGKQQYKYFLAYKEYLAGLIYARETVATKIQSKLPNDLEIPKKLLIDNVFKRILPNAKLSQPTKPKLGIFNFFNIIFRQNRFFNHKILAQQFLINIFGTEGLLAQNFTEYIQKQNQRSGENFYQILYVILLAGDRNPVVGKIKNPLELTVIKQKVYQAMADKSVGSLMINLNREIIGQRKSSLSRRNPKKYRLKPYSLFETLQTQPLKRKKQALNSLLKISSPNKSIMYGFIELLLSNLNFWTKPQRCEIVWGIIIPWINQRIQTGQIIESTIDAVLNVTVRLARRAQVQIKPQHEQIFVQILSNHLPKLFEKISKGQKERRRFLEVQAYLLDLEWIFNNNDLHFRNLNPLLKRCYEIIMNNNTAFKKNQVYEESKFYSPMLTHLLRLIDLSESNKKVFTRSSQRTSSLQSQKTDAGSSKKMFNSSKRSFSPNQKDTVNLNKKSSDTSDQKVDKFNNKMSTSHNNRKQQVKTINSQDQKDSASISRSSLFKNIQKNPQIQKTLEAHKGIFSKKTQIK